MEFIDGTLSGAVKVGKAVGIGFAIVKITDDGKHGECKAFGGDHVVEVTTVRPAIYGEPEFDLALAKEEPPGVQKDVTRVCRMVLTEDAAKSCGVFLEAPPEVGEGTPSTGASATGGWQPPNSTPPMTLADMGSITPLPSTAWVDGQCVILGDASTAYWDGAAWVAGAAPAAGGFSAKSGHGAGHPTQLPAPKKSGLKQDSF